MNTITIDRAVVEQALEALESSRVFVTSREKIKHPEGTEWYDERIAALRAALAQEQAEPQRTSAWWRDGLTATLMREGVNKHRAREIADGYWQAYCEIGGNDD